MLSGVLTFPKESYGDNHEERSALLQNLVTLTENM